MNNDNQLSTQAKSSVLVALGTRYNVEPSRLLETMRQTLARNATNEELIAFSIVANQYKLNPFVKEIYAFPAKGGGIVPMVSVDGWLRLINTHPQFDGMEVNMPDDGKTCTVVIYRKDTSHPTVITEYLEECKRNTDPWNKSPRRMLRHKAIIQAGRVAFGFGGIYDEDEGRYISEAPIRSKESPQTGGIKLASEAGESIEEDPGVIPGEVVEDEPADQSKSMVAAVIARAEMEGISIKELHQVAQKMRVMRSIDDELPEAAAEAILKEWDQAVKIILDRREGGKA